MAYRYYGLSVNRQAAEPETLMTAHGTSDSAVDVALTLDGAYEGSASEFDLAGACVDDGDYRGLLQKTAIVAKRPSSHQAGTCKEAQAEQQLWDPKGAQQPYVWPPDEEWDYVVEVWPGIDDGYKKGGLKSLVDHIFEVQTEFEKKNIDYRFSIRDPTDQEDLALFGQCRCYVLPRQYRDSERNRLKFLQIFGHDRRYNKALEGYHYKMSVCEVSRNPLPSKPYASPADTRGTAKVTGFNPLNPNSDPTLIPSSPSSPFTGSPSPTTPTNRLSSPISFADGKTGAPKNTQPRMKPIPKPQRPVVKNRDGRFICTWKDCSAAVKDFARKCEWR
ncbi:hypothetical protein ONZ43_g104 [Nemania bipapillata]|uniref:Uncharacterized protein n=1 Tax=Nemania bipapillata TaxID=110536 RepID=A0ACC2J9D6_9PEZI|nr:hypothetical protein ONZ43_g104 [Nemania bipapillata]